MLADPVNPAMEFTAVSLHNQSGESPALIVCEHASNHIPAAFDDLGLNDDVLVTHIAWDPGADSVARHLSHLLDAPYVRGEISRLVYDCNRPPEAIDAIISKSEVHYIPGNLNLSEEERQKRAELIYEPFNACLTEAARKCGALITVHSFTPIYNGKFRPVELGILHDEDSAFADMMMAVAQTQTEFIIRRNQPYGPEDGVTHTLKVHGIVNNIPNVMIEIRNDLITSEAACETMAQTLAGLITECLPSLLPSRKEEGKK